MWQEGIHGPEQPRPVPSQPLAPPEHAGSPPGPTATPYKFLDYFEEEEHDRFAGRDDEVREALVGLTRGRTYVVYGRSGLGKTSLTLAGLFPRLRQRGLHPMRVRLLDSPVANFCAALATELERPELAREMGDAERLERVPRVLAEYSVREPLVIALDQFEEFFVRFKGQPQEQARLTELLGRIWHERGANVRLVFVMREDYYASLADLRSSLPDLTDNGLRLMPLTAYGARQAIVRPLQQEGVAYEEAFVSRVVDELAPWLFEPPALQIVCTELYRDVVARRGYPVHLTRDDLDRLGGVEGLFSGYVHRVTSGLAGERLLLVRVVLDALLASEGRTRRAVRAEDLLGVPVRADLGELREVLGHLTELRLLRVEDRQGERWYELLHEPLVPIIEAWLNTDVDYVRFRQARKFVSSLTQDMHWRRDPGWLLSAEQLTGGVEPWKERLRLDAEQVEFLLRSTIHAKEGSIGYWAGRLDELRPGHSTELLLELFGHSRHDTRLAAVAASGQVRDTTGQLASRCLDLALSASEETMRRTAGSSFARLAGLREIESLRQQFARRGPSEPLLEVLADLHEAHHPLAGFSRRWRRRARDLVNERGVERNQRTIRRLVNAGVRTALIATLVWCLSFGLVNLAYRLCTDFPGWVSQGNFGALMLVSLAMVLPLTLFLCLPVAGVVAWQVTRRSCTQRVLHGRQEWTRAALRSPTVLICAVLMAAILTYLFQGIRFSLRPQYSVATGFEPVRTLLWILGGTLLSWLMTAGLVWLGSRCIPPHASTPKLFIWALLSSSFLPIAAELLVGGMVIRGWIGKYAVVWLGVMTLTSTVSSLLAMVLVCALYKSQEELRGPAQGPRRRSLVLARAVVVAAIVGAIAGVHGFIGFDSIPFHGGRQLRGELALRGSVWRLADADYITIRAPHEGTYALSMRGESGPDIRLLINGNAMTNGSLLVAARPELTAAVVARVPEPKPGVSFSSHSDYDYVLREEPIDVRQPRALSNEHWTLVRLPLSSPMGSEGPPSLWQLRLEGQVSPEQRKDMTGVEVRPVMLQIGQLPARRCVAIVGAPGFLPVSNRTVIARNQMETEVVPPPDSQAELLLEDFRSEFEEGGRWALMMTLIPFQDYTPPQCQEPGGLLSLLQPQRGPAPGVAGQEPTLMLALKLY